MTRRDSRQLGRSMAWSLVVPIGWLMLLLPSCRVPPAPPTLLFQQGDANCASPEEIDRARISWEGGDLALRGLIRTPTPCRHLLPTLVISRCRIELRVVTVPQPGACPLCLGEVAYTARIAGLQPGTYTVVVRHEDFLVLDLAVTVPAPQGTFLPHP